MVHYLFRTISLGLPIENNNKINIYTNVLDKFNSNNFECEFSLDFKKIFFSKVNDFVKTNKLTNKTQTFNIFIKDNSQIRNFNNSYDKSTKVENYKYINRNYVATTFDNTQYILSTTKTNNNLYNNNLLEIQKLENNMRNNTNSKFTFIYNNNNNSYKISNFNNNILLSEQLANSFIFGIKENYIKLNNSSDTLEKTNNNALATKFKLINIIENSDEIYCDIITKKENNEVFSFSKNIDKNISQEIFEDVDDIYGEVLFY